MVAVPVCKVVAPLSYGLSSLVLNSVLYQSNQQWNQYARQLLEEQYREMEINWTMVFTDLENAYDGVTKKKKIVAGFKEKKG